MTMTAKFAGRCSTCGGRIAAGTQIEWSKGAGARHVECASGAAATPAVQPGPIALHGGSGNGCQGWTVGQVILSGEKRRRDGGPDALVIVTASRRYVREDGLSFGVGDDQGYLYTATARPATAEEMAPAIEAAHAQAIEAERAAELKRIYAAIEAGERLPEDEADRLASAAGESVLLAPGVHGGRRWVRIESDSLVLLDGGYYDEYRRSAWRVARTPDLERRVRALATV